MNEEIKSDAKQALEKIFDELMVDKVSKETAKKLKDEIESIDGRIESGTEKIKKELESLVEIAQASIEDLKEIPETIKSNNIEQFNQLHTTLADNAKDIGWKLESIETTSKGQLDKLNDLVYEINEVDSKIVTIKNNNIEQFNQLHTALADKAEDIGGKLESIETTSKDLKGYTEKNITEQLNKLDYLVSEIKNLNTKTELANKLNQISCSIQETIGAGDKTIIEILDEHNKKIASLDEAISTKIQLVLSAIETGDKTIKEILDEHSNKFVSINENVSKAYVNIKPDVEMAITSIRNILLSQDVLTAEKFEKQIDGIQKTNKNFFIALSIGLVLNAALSIFAIFN